MRRKTDIFLRWVAWWEEDQTYIGHCPDLFLGGVHGDNPLKVARELQKVIDEWGGHFQKRLASVAASPRQADDGDRMMDGLAVRKSYRRGRVCGVAAITGRRERTKRKSLRRLKV